MAWDYGAYQESLKSASTDYNAALGELSSFGPEMAQRAQNIYKEILAQQKAGSEQYWYKGNTASNQAAAADVALRLTENGVGSLSEVGQRSKDIVSDFEGTPITTQGTELFNKKTGEALPRPDLFGGNSGRSNLDIVYNLHFTDSGDVMPYTSNKTSEWVSTYRPLIKQIGAIALSAYGVPYLSSALAGTTVAGVTLTAGSAALAGVSAGLVSGGVSLLSGNSFEDALKSALVGGLTAGATAGYADTIGQSLGFDAGSVASKAAGQAIIAGAKAGITDENVLQSMATAAVTAYMSNKEPSFDATEREGSLAKFGVDDTMTTDFSAGANYSLTSGLKFGSTEGINVDNRGVGEGYELTGGTTPFTGLQTATSPNLTAMGGGTGITATRDDGTTLAGKDFTTGPSKTDIKTAVKIGGVLMADKAITDITMGNNTTTAATQNKDKYRNAPLAGFRMVKFDDPVGGGSKYIPFVGEKSLLPPPAGYNKAYAKGGFVSKPVKRNGLASRK